MHEDIKSPSSSNDSKAITYFVGWEDSEASLPKRKELEVELLQALEQLVIAYGGEGVTIDEITDVPERRGKQLSLQIKGDVDFDALQECLRILDRRQPHY